VQEHKLIDLFSKNLNTEFSKTVEFFLIILPMKKKGTSN